MPLPDGICHYYPRADVVSIKDESREEFLGGPDGITIHYTAGLAARSTIHHLANTVLNYHILIDRDGEIIQTGLLSNTVFHAGQAEWQGLSPNSNHVAVALCNWGELTKEGDVYRSWAGTQLSDKYVNYSNQR